MACLLWLASKAANADRPNVVFILTDNQGAWTLGCYSHPHIRTPNIDRLAAEVSGVDDGVGEIMATLKRLGLDDNTRMIYAADQGWMGAQHGLWGMGDHTPPIGAHELMRHIRHAPRDEPSSSRGA